MLTLLINARAFQFGSGMMLVGVMAFRWLVLLPAFGREPEDVWQGLRPFCQRLNRLFIGSAIILLLSGVAQFWAVAAEMNDCSLADALNRETWATVLFQTHFGAVSEWRLGFALLLAVLLALPAWKNWPFQNRRTPLEIMVGMLALALTISPAGTGHAAASGSGIFSLHIAADGLHLLAASIWPTGLLPFALLLRNWGRNSEPNVTGPIIIAVHRFSNLSLFIVVVLIITGFINSLFLVGTFSAMVMTDYGRLLCLKLALFMVILACAGWNRFRLLPLLSARDETAVLPRLRLFVAVEFGLAVVIVGVVSILGITPPPG